MSRFDPRRLVLPIELRDELTVPLGPVYTGSDEFIVAKVLAVSGGGIIISVGDICSQTLLDGGLKPDLIVTDGHTKRSIGHEVTDKAYEDVFTENPAGEISEAAWGALRETIKTVSSSHVKIHIRVHGEEDLLAIPATLEAPLGSLIVYGQPDEGVVLVSATNEMKKRLVSLLHKFRWFDEKR